MSSDAEYKLEVEPMEGPQIASKTKSGEEDVAANGDADTRKALPPAGDDSEEDEEDLDDKCDELQVVVFSERPRPSMTAMKSTGGGFGRIIRHTAMKSTGGYSARRKWNATSAYTRKAPPPAEDDSEEAEDDINDEPQLAAVRGRTPMTAMKSTGGGFGRTIRRTAMKCTGGGFARRARNAASAYTRKAPPPAEDDSEEDEEDLDDESQLATFRGRAPMTAMKSTGVGVRRTIRRTAMKCTGGGFARRARNAASAYTRKAPPPVEDDSEEDDEDLHDEPQLATSRGRPRTMTAMKSTGGGFGRTVRRTAMKCTGGFAAYTHKAPPPSGDDLEEDEEDEEFEGKDESGGEDEAESDIDDEDGMDKEQNEDDENGANGEQQTETECSNVKTKAGKFLEGGAEEAVTTKRKRLSD
ncbi:hypothetical protein AAVH_20111 [Aphelenchoides avenae]|nr:hypothetical protein AAVH_20111 [Aphelenchus avenae]